MKNRYTLLEIRRFLKSIKSDYNNSTIPNKSKKRECFIKIIINVFLILWNGITAPFIYPVWFLFKRKITNKIYRNTSWQEIESLISNNSIKIAHKKLKENGSFLYWIWTYGDMLDPLGRGGLPSVQKNTFFNRFWFSAIRNPRFNINHMNFRTDNIVSFTSVIDTKNSNIMHTSEGIGDSPDGIVFRWMKDINEKWYFIYEDSNSQNLLYVGYVGLLKNGTIGKSGRFELSYRQTKSTYFKI